MRNCENCKYLCEEEHNTECGIDYDVYCKVKGYEYDSKECKTPGIILAIQAKRYDMRKQYYMQHEFEGIGEWYEQMEKEVKALEEILMDEFPENKEAVRYKAADIHMRYEEKAHPIERKGLKEQWKEVLVNTRDAGIGLIRKAIYG